MPFSASHVCGGAFLKLPGAASGDTMPVQDVEPILQPDHRQCISFRFTMTNIVVITHRINEHQQAVSGITVEQIRNLHIVAQVQDFEQELEYSVDSQAL